MSRLPIPPWIKRDCLSTPAHQRLVDGINALSPISPPEGTEFISTPFGSGIVDRRILQPSTDVTVVKLTGSLAGLGWYEGKLVIWQEIANVGADALLADLVNNTKTDAQDPVALLSTWEIDSDLGGRAMSTSANPVLFIAVRTSLVSNETPPRPVYLIVGDQPILCGIGGG